MNENPLSPDDPLLTAYALGELEDPERAAVEAALAANPALRAAVDDIRATATQLETALATEPMPIASAVVMPHAPRARVVRFPVAYYIIGGLAAASFAVLVVRYQPPPRTVPQQEQRQYVEIPVGPASGPAMSSGDEERASVEAKTSAGISMPIAADSSQDQAGKPEASRRLVIPVIPVIPVGPAEPPVPAPLTTTFSTTLTLNAGRTASVSPLLNGPPAYDWSGISRAAQPASRLASANPPAVNKPAAKVAGAAPGGVVALNPFEVDANKDIGYYAANTLAGSRLNTKIGDFASSITIVTKQQLDDGGAPDINDAKAAAASIARGAYGGVGGRPGVPAPVSGIAGARTLAWGISGADGGTSFGTATSDRARVGRQAVPNTETYGLRQDNQFVAVASEPLSTFSIDVDTAGYSNVRRFLQGGQLPPRDAVRIEELVNYFPYRYAPPANNLPFAATLEVAAAPWEPKHRLVRIGLKGREVTPAARPAANLVFLLDVSGSMAAPNRLPLVKESLHLLVGELRDDDHVAIVTYAGKTGLELPSTPAAHSREILAALDGLQASGSTDGGMGLQLAYDIAKANFVPGGVNRVILCTDGDFNVGVTNQGDLVRLIEEKAKSNVFLTVFGFGYGNLKDSTLELLADKGNGNYGYIDSRREAEKLLVEQVGGTLVTIAKDVKIQVEFNPAQASAYRLIGYENRLLKKEDFNNDQVDAGEIGAGHTVTALYEVIPAGANEPMPAVSVDELKYQRTEEGGRKSEAGSRRTETGGRKPEVSGELLTVKIRYKEPTGDESRKLEFPLTDRGADFAAASGDFKFAAAVAGFGLALRADPIEGGLLADAARWADEGMGNDPGGYRAEFTGLVRQAQALVR